MSTAADLAVISGGLLPHWEVNHSLPALNHLVFKVGKQRLVKC